MVSRSPKGWTTNTLRETTVYTPQKPVRFPSKTTSVVLLMLVFRDQVFGRDRKGVHTFFAPVLVFKSVLFQSTTSITLFLLIVWNYTLKNLGYHQFETL